MSNYEAYTAYRIFERFANGSIVEFTIIDKDNGKYMYRGTILTNPYPTSKIIKIGGTRIDNERDEIEEGYCTLSYVGDGIVNVNWSHNQNQGNDINRADAQAMIDLAVKDLANADEVKKSIRPLFHVRWDVPTRHYVGELFDTYSKFVWPDNYDTTYMLVDILLADDSWFKINGHTIGDTVDFEFKDSEGHTLSTQITIDRADGPYLTLSVTEQTNMHSYIVSGTRPFGPKVINVSTANGTSNVLDFKDVPTGVYSVGYRKIAKTVPLQDAPALLGFTSGVRRELTGTTSPHVNQYAVNLTTKIPVPGVMSNVGTQHVTGAKLYVNKEANPNFLKLAVSYTDGSSGYDATIFGMLEGGLALTANENGVMLQLTQIVDNSF